MTVLNHQVTGRQRTNAYTLFSNDERGTEAETPSNGVNMTLLGGFLSVLGAACLAVSLALLPLVIPSIILATVGVACLVPGFRLWTKSMIERSLSTHEPNELELPSAPAVHQG